MQQTDLQPGDVVQIDPEYQSCLFRGCFMLVTEVRSWGAIGFISCPGSREEMPGRAYFRCPWQHMELVGKAAWVTKDDDAK